MTPKGQLSLASVVRVPTSGWSLVQQHCCHLAFIPFLAKTGPFAGWGWEAWTRSHSSWYQPSPWGLGGCAQFPWCPSQVSASWGQMLRSGGLTPSSESRPLTPASRMPISINKS